MKLEYRFSLKDYQDAFYAFYKSHRSLYFSLWVESLVFLILGMGIIFYFATISKSSIEDILIPSLLIGGPPISIGILLNPHVFFSLCSRRIRSSSLTLTPIIIEISEEFFYLKIENIELKFQWQFIQSKHLKIKLIESGGLKKYFFISVNSTLPLLMIILMIPVPKRIFTSDEQLEEFREILRTKIENSR